MKGLEHVLSRVDVEQGPSETVPMELLPVTKKDVKVSLATCISEVTIITVPDPPYEDDAMKKAEYLLSRVQQKSSESMETALLPIVTALMAQPLLKHPNEDVKVSVACCISEFTRVTAPDQPHDDEDMKEVLELTVLALGKLSLGSGRCYSKAVSILQNLAICRSCVLMLDLECSNLIVDMIKLFVGAARSNHSDSVFSDMETIMTIVIDESDEIPVIRSTKMENQNDSPLQWKLGENVCKRCAPKIHACLPHVAELMNEDLNDITRVVLPVLLGVSEREHLEMRSCSAIGSPERAKC